MKKFIGIALLALATASVAQAEVLKGYVNLDRRGTPYFVAVDPAKWELTAMLPIHNFFSDEQQDVMMDCMDKKTTHVILIDQIPATQTNVPTDIPGRKVTTHFPRYENIRCLPAPDFLLTWREIVRASKFR